MRRKILVLTVLMHFMLSGANAGKIVHVYEFNRPEISYSGPYGIVYFEGTKLAGQTGKATLPFYPVKILLPPGEKAESISISYKDPVVLQEKIMLMPFQEVRPLSDPGESLMAVDEIFYQSTTPYPSYFKPHLETQFFNGCGIALSSFTPISYLPKENQITYYQRVEIEIITLTDPAQSHNKHFFGSEQKSLWLKDLVQNPEKISDYFSGREFLTSEYDILVITKNQYLGEFDTLKSFYELQGLKTKVAATETIGSSMSGIDLQQKIRNFIIQEYDDNGISYVVLGGDTEIVPYRGFYCYVQSGGGYSSTNIPADVYYSALDGSWNNDGDARWGEPDEDDLYPEVAIGRITFSDTAELHNILHKSFLYQCDPVEGELTKPLLAGEELYDDPYTIGSDYLNLLIGYRTDNGYSTHGIPPSHPRDTLYDDSTYYWSKATLISHINSGRPWLHHVGHANQSYVMKLSLGDITDANFAQTNGVTHNYTVVYTHGCICGGFDYTDCIGERMIGIDNFASAFVGNSRYGWFNQGTTDGPSQHLHREFMDALYYDSLYRIGMAHLKSKSETAPFVEIGNEEFEPGATRWCFYDNNVLGDPVMALRTEEPQDIALVSETMVPASSASVAVQLESSTGNVKGLSCALMKNDTLYGSALTDGSGLAVIYPDSVLAEGEYHLWITGYNILPQMIPIHACNYWLGYSPDWGNPANWFTGHIPDSTSYIIIPSQPAGTKFPSFNSSTERHCRHFMIEENAQFRIGPGETLKVWGD
ncbi:MAG: hypothetical protein KBC43_07025 [Bacteroidales bacterium]|nr:hypothetical protein [Bacteroidales bacterium]